MFTATKGRSYITDQVRMPKKTMPKKKTFASALPLCARPWTKTSGETSKEDSGWHKNWATASDPLWEALRGTLF